MVIRKNDLNSFWEALRSSIYFKEAHSDAELIATATAPLVEKFPSIAGSISIESSTYLWLLTKYFSPKNVLEIGTYIGRSTLAINFGGLYSIERFWTCDGTFSCMNFNDLEITSFSDEKSKSVRKIEYYGKTMSTELLKKSIWILMQNLILFSLMEGCLVMTLVSYLR